MGNEVQKPARKILLGLEMTGVFIVAPLIASLEHIARWQIHLSLWIVTGYAVFRLTRNPRFSWRGIWRGYAWNPAQRRFAIWRYVALVPVLLGFTLMLAPERFLQFPLERPALWAVVMVLYPLLSALPQEFVYRTFFYERYHPVFSNKTAMILASAFCFGFVHIMFHNWVAPVFSGLGGILFGLSYTQHRSLKWVAIEHAIYGCTVFTLGLGWYFYGAAGH